jgi:Na+/H+-dicarboxylate symporter
MCASHSSQPSLYRNGFILYTIVIGLGITSGMLNFEWLNNITGMISEAFVKIFKCLSLPLISLSMIVTITSYHGDKQMKKLSQKTLCYTLVTTIIAAIVACVLYLMINPTTPQMISLGDNLPPIKDISYLQHISQLIPSHMFEPFIEHNVMSVLLLAIVVGSAIRFIPDERHREIISGFFQALHSIFITLTRWVIKIIPLALYSFIAVMVLQLRKGLDISGIGEYLSIVILANMVQGLFVLPLWLRLQGISPFQTMRKVMPALSLAFFSKSSTGTLPMTIQCVERNLKTNPTIARFVLPLCTTINMNGCAAFIFSTVIYLSQSHGIEITFLTMVSWIIIATIAAIGNAGVPMGCFFLSASLLSSMGVPLTLLGLILPFYSIIDMIETSLNVWSDVCVTQVINREFKENIQ